MDLIVNESKTELKHVERDKDRVAEEWRVTRKLGSLLGDREDVNRQIQLSTAAFIRLWSLWVRGSMVNEQARVRIYNAFILPIICYNSGTWALPQAELNKLESHHRRQLRRVIGVVYPAKIRNSSLYQRTGTEPLGMVILKARWRLFGHTLRMGENTPARLAMAAYFTRMVSEPCWRGRPPICLPQVLHKDLTRIGRKLASAADLAALHSVAQARPHWVALSN